MQAIFVKENIAFYIASSGVFKTLTSTKTLRVQQTDCPHAPALDTLTSAVSEGDPRSQESVKCATSAVHDKVGTKTEAS